MLITHTDGHVHFSDLKELAKSAAHYKYRCANPTTPTADMLIGSAVNQLVLGKSPRKPLLRFESSAKSPRLTNEYKAFKAANPGHEVLLDREWADAKDIAAAVVQSDPAVCLLQGSEYEVPLTWGENGISYATTGVDIIGRAQNDYKAEVLKIAKGTHYIADLKVVHNAEPEYLQNHCRRMNWHAQLVWYRDGWMCVTGERQPALYLLCVESSPPHCVTVLQLTPEVIDHGERCVRAWQERLKVCADSDCWPGYSQAVVPFALPEWMTEMEGFDE